MPIDEDRVPHPESPCGESKLIVAQGLHWLAARGRLGYAALRYFNAAGHAPTHPASHDPEIFLTPRAFGPPFGRGVLSLFSIDCSTDDGTCDCDYVHVSDRARAHVLAIDALELLPEIVVNLGMSAAS